MKTDMGWESGGVSGRDLGAGEGLTISHGADELGEVVGEESVVHDFVFPEVVLFF